MGGHDDDQTNADHEDSCFQCGIEIDDMDYWTICGQCGHVLCDDCVIIHCCVVNSHKSEETQNVRDPDDKRHAGVGL
jgi:hypothetical protein